MKKLYVQCTRTLHFVLSVPFIVEPVTVPGDMEERGSTNILFRLRTPHTEKRQRDAYTKHALDFDLLSVIWLSLLVYPVSFCHSFFLSSCRFQMSKRENNGNCAKKDAKKTFVCRYLFMRMLQSNGVVCFDWLLLVFCGLQFFQVLYSDDMLAFDFRILFKFPDDSTYSCRIFVQEKLCIHYWLPC